MKKITPLLCCLITTALSSYSQQKTGMFDGNEDVGNPVKKGMATYNSEKQEYTMSCGGKNMWANDDQFHFLWKKIKGDFMISATVRFIGKGTDPHRKIGVIARNVLTANSPYADACVHGDGLTSLQSRHADTAQTTQVILASNAAVNIELQRIGNTFTFSAATPGENYKTATKELVLNEEVYAGPFICSHNENVVEQAVFSNVRIIIPAAKDFRPYRDYIGSHIEVMDVQTGLRKILYSAPNSLQAPNWTKDGKYLIYNSEGLLYKYDLTKNTNEKLNTGFANQNNNDHVLSFDGRQIAISNHVGEKRISTIFMLPLTGSDKPIQITSADSGHSYLHSWSPDGKKLIFTGQRKNQFDIWSVDIATKKETALTNTPTLDDGPEYTPDGKWIYFNSVRTGTMKLWRMKPDGTNQEQITFDEYNDWFPHISPDGKWIVYISFPKEIDPADHPFYKKVYLRLMPSSGGVPKTIAYVYGGQGTINTPSWSPDSKKIAFVSNTQLK
ncbi:MAG TPA: biopolymer transporter TolR [Chitinophagaceae bacterium]|nr:biopolymer transporter TolR [Chitinophagaceae bacterium]